MKPLNCPVGCTWSNNDVLLNALGCNNSTIYCGMLLENKPLSVTLWKSCLGPTSCAFNRGDCDDDSILSGEVNYVKCIAYATRIALS